MSRLPVTALLFLAGLALKLNGQTFPPSGQLAVGGDFAVVVNASGVVSTWGEGGLGQLGSNATGDRTAPGAIYTPSGGTVLRRVSISAGATHVLAIHSSTTSSLDRSVWAWGGNAYGQIGDNTVANKLSRVRIGTFSNANNNGAVAVAAGESHSLMATTAGHVYAWGQNYSGQLGDGSNIDRRTPVQVKGVGGIGYLTGITAVAAGNNHSYALNGTTGQIYAWGSNGNGRLGDGSSNSASSTPVLVTASGLSQVVAIAAGKFYGMALTANGQVWAWGSGVKPHPYYSSNVPIQLHQITNAVSIDAGDYHWIVKCADGSVVCGKGYVYTEGDDGEAGPISEGGVITNLGPGSFDASGRENLVVSVSAGNQRSGAILSSGAVITWGKSLGVNETAWDIRRVPVKVTNAKDIYSIFAGGDVSYSKNTSGRIFLWGANHAHFLHNGFPGYYDGAERNAPLPHALDNHNQYYYHLRGATQIASYNDYASEASPYYGSFSVIDGRIYVFGGSGAYYKGWITQGWPGSGANPVELNGITDIACGYGDGFGFAIALKSDNTIWVWGDNQRGQLGLASNSTTIYTPQRLILPLQNGATPKFIGAGEGHIFIIDSDGFGYAAGDNSKNQFGNGSSVSSSSIIRITNSSNSALPMIPTTYGAVSGLAVGANHTLVMTAQGRVYTWGEGLYGKLGNSATTNLSAPTLRTFTGALQVAAGANHSVVRRANDVIAFGLNDRGQIGNGGTANVSSTATVTGLGSVTSVAAGKNHTLALLNDGTVAAWGDNSRSQLGHAAGGITRAPINIGNLTSANDANANGIDDTWAVAQNVASVAATADTDVDMLTNVNEFQHDSNPRMVDTDGDLLTDFADSYPRNPFNGNSYNITFVSGFGQAVAPDSVAPKPMVINVGIPGVTVLIDSPYARVADSIAGLSSGQYQVQLLSNAQGLVSCYFATESGPWEDIIAPIFAYAGVDWAFAEFRALSDATDSDGDGLVDSEELRGGSQINNWDTDGDGVKDGWDYAPLNSAVSAEPNTSVLTINLVTPGDAVRIY